MRKSLVCLAWLFIILMAITTAAGCRDNINPGQIDDPPGGDDPTPGGDDPGPGDPNQGENSGSDTSLNAPVTTVPASAISSIDRAIIRNGDLWLCASDGRMWRQTQAESITDVAWAPDGHALSYTIDNGPHASLFYLQPGNSPVAIYSNVNPYTVWLSKNGYMWSPDSTKLAYAISGAAKMGITQVAGFSQEIYSLDKEMSHAPYWIANDTLIYTAYDGDRPSGILINVQGNIIAELADTTCPLTVPGGAMIATGTYDPDGMISFYTDGLAKVFPNGTLSQPVYGQPVHNSLLALDPAVTQSSEHQYLAISDGDSLFLHKYAGPANPAYPNNIDLLTQDLFLTYSEFCYPFWFSWAPDGSSLAALKFSFTQEGDYGDQEGYWDLVRVDRTGNESLLKAKVYSVSGFNNPVPFQSVQPINWSPCGGYVNYLMEQGDAYNLWKVNISTKAAELVLESCSLPEYRPLP